MAERQSAWMSFFYKLRINLIWHRMLYSCTHVAIVDVKGFGCRILFMLSLCSLRHKWRCGRVK